MSRGRDIGRDTGSRSPESSDSRNGGQDRGSPSISSREHSRAPIQVRALPRELSRDRDARARAGRRPSRHDHQKHIRDVELDALHEIGRFATIAVADLDLPRDSLRGLRREGAIELHRTSLKGESIQAVALTQKGKEQLHRERPQTRNEALYLGVTQPRQLAHDATLFRVYRAESARIRSRGGRPTRVVLGDELKKRVLSDLNKEEASRRYRDKSRREVAARHHLTVVNNKIPIPDLRIEYQTRDGREKRSDVELATDHYRPGQLAEKTQAGFTIYGLSSSSSQGGAAQQDRELTEEILSL